MSVDDLERWPVLPDGVEGVLRMRLPDDYDPGPAECAGCGRRIEPMENVLGDDDGIWCSSCR